MATASSLTSSWCRDTDDWQVKAFLAWKGARGYDARRIDGKVSLRAVWQAESR